MINPRTRARPSSKRTKRRNQSLGRRAILLVPLAALAMACGDNGGKKDGGSVATTSANQSNPVFVSAGTTDAKSSTRQLRISVGSPLPVASSSGVSRQLALGPNAVRP